MHRASILFCITSLGLLVGTAAGQNLRLTVDRTSGAVGVENTGSEDVSVKGYTIGSAGEYLSPDDWASLADAGLTGWLEANPSAAYLSELNLEGASVLTAGDSVGLGNAYVPGPQKGDLFFEYINSDLDVVNSIVRYTGPANDLAIYVDPDTGEAAMANLSPFIDVPSIKGYSILSPSGGLVENGWTSFATSGSGGEGWIEANPTTEHLSELNLENSTTFENNTIIPLGMIIGAGSATRDLVFEYFTTDGNVLTGSVEYIPLPGTMSSPGDCNGDGVVDAADLACACGTGALADVLATTGLLEGDLDADGSVAFADFLVLSANFGQSVDSYAMGDIDCDGQVAFADFLMLSANFGQTSASLAAAVPEPATSLLWAPAAMLLVGWRGRGCRP